MKRLTIFVCSVIALVGVAQAELLTVTLDNGAVFETRYRPKVSPDQPGVVMLLTDQGNWISLPESRVTSVISEFEARGFGLRIDTTTVSLGFKPAEAQQEDATAATDPTQALLQYLTAQDAARNIDYSVPQFVNPNEGSGGIPIGFTGRTTPPLGGADVDTLDVIDN